MNLYPFFEHFAKVEKVLNWLTISGQFREHFSQRELLLCGVMNEDTWIELIKKNSFKIIQKAGRISNPQFSENFVERNVLCRPKVVLVPVTTRGSILARKSLLLFNIFSTQAYVKLVMKFYLRQFHDEMRYTTIK